MEEPGKLNDQTNPADWKDGAAAGLEIEVKRSLNVPPALWALDVRSGKSRRLWEPNPEFEHMKFGAISQLSLERRDWI